MTEVLKLSVVMGVYNTAPYLGAALDGLLAQSFSSFELICVDDGSTDDSLAILNGYAAKDARVQVVAFPENRGVSCALNEAITRCRAPYIAIADADDLYFPTRFEKQVRFLETYPDYVAVGSSMAVMENDGKLSRFVLLPQNDEALQWRTLFNSPFLQPTVMVRADALRKLGSLYRPDLKASEDYELWSRLARQGKFYNFKEPFLVYRKHGTSLSHTREAEQIRARDAISHEMLHERLGDHGLSNEAIGRVRHIFINQFRPVLKPTEGDWEAYKKLLSLFVRTLPAREARLFLYEEQSLFEKNYLAEIGVSAIELMDCLGERCP